MAMAASSWNPHLRPRLVDQGTPPAQLLLPTEGNEAVEEETREWADLPLDALLAVLRRLDVVDILMGPGHVCRPWRRVTREEPDLWRHIDMRHHANRVDLQPAARAAVRRSAGRCEAFWAQGLDVDSGHFTLFLADA